MTDIVHNHSVGCTEVDFYLGLPTPLVSNASWTAVLGWEPVTDM